MQVLQPALQAASRAFSTAAPPKPAGPVSTGAPAAAPAPQLPADMMEVFVNGEPVVIPKSFTVLQACDAAGVDIPRLDLLQRFWISSAGRWCSSGLIMPSL